MTMHKTIKESIEIMASADAVWEYFTNPSLSRALGGEYVSTWEAGAEIGWMGLEGEMYTKGYILEIEPAVLLTHTLTDMEDTKRVLCTITYTFEEEDGITLFTGKAFFKEGLNDSEYEDAQKGWRENLEAIKELVEL